MSASPTYRWRLSPTIQRAPESVPNHTWRCTPVCISYCGIYNYLKLTARRGLEEIAKAPRKNGVRCSAIGRMRSNEINGLRRYWRHQRRWQPRKLQAEAVKPTSAAPRPTARVGSELSFRVCQFRDHGRSSAAMRSISARRKASNRALGWRTRKVVSNGSGTVIALPHSASIVAAFQTMF